VRRLKWYGVAPICPSPVISPMRTCQPSGERVEAIEVIGRSDKGDDDRQPRRRRLGLSHLPEVAIGITEVKPLDARARAIQVILNFVDLDALCFELIVRRFNI
jgi:hypothetical protein